MMKSHRGRYYIDNSQWGPEADAIESGYRAPFGKMHVFIGKIGAPVPEPDTFTDIVEPSRYAHPAKHQVRKHHAFVGFTQGTDQPDEPVIQEITPVKLDDESSIGDTDSIYPLHEGQLGGLPEAVISEDVEGPHHQVAIYMAGAAPPQPNAVAENQEAVNAELTKLREEMAKIQRDIEGEAARMATQRAQITVETERLNTEGWRLERQQHASDAIHQRRHHNHPQPI
ncbi:hypothetical protein ZWY2020_032966 [Hordeum vulgare]|nr:hypothetical protein ZWY2020_032966 [Hordeum vulgare]